MGIRYVKPGDVISLVQKNEDDKKITRRWIVEKVYKNCVLAVCGSRRQCIPYGTLVQCGMEKQDPEKEALRKERNGEGWSTGGKYGSFAKDPTRCQECVFYVMTEERTKEATVGICKIGKRKRLLYGSAKSCECYKRKEI